MSTSLCWPVSASTMGVLRECQALQVLQDDQPKAHTGFERSVSAGS